MQIARSCYSNVVNACTTFKDSLAVSERYEKIKRVILRCLQSPLFYTALLTLPFLATRNIYYIPVALLYAIYERKQLLYEASLLPTLFFHTLKPANRPWSNHILPSKLVLSAIPCSNMDHHKVSANRVVLTLLEEHELRSSIFTEPVQPDEWKNQGTIHHTIPAVDFQGVALEQIRDGVKFVHEQILAGKEVLVHCKAGRGRSATIVICYLLTHGGMKSVDEAIQFVKARRNVININRSQRAAIDAYFAAG